MGIVLCLLAALAVACLITQWAATRPDNSNELPPLVIPLSHTPADSVSWQPFAREARGSEREASTTKVPFAPSPPPRTAAPSPPASSKTSGSERAPEHIRDAPDVPLPLRVVRDFPDFDEPAPLETVRFRRRDDEPVQLLPGRLEVLAGDRRQQEIRFVRLPGRPPELILGRDPGTSAQHVMLGSTTVSRQHARFTFADGSWTVANLSRTNPVVVNDEELSARDSGRLLADGDRLEMGEVVLRFHAH